MMGTVNREGRQEIDNGGGVVVRLHGISLKCYSVNLYFAQNDLFLRWQGQNENSYTNNT